MELNEAIQILAEHNMLVENTQINTKQMDNQIKELRDLRSELYYTGVEVIMKLKDAGIAVNSSSITKDEDSWMLNISTKFGKFSIEKIKNEWELIYHMPDINKYGGTMIKQNKIANQIIKYTQGKGFPEW